MLRNIPTRPVGSARLAWSNFALDIIANIGFGVAFGLSPDPRVGLLISNGGSFVGAFLNLVASFYKLPSFSGNEATQTSRFAGDYAGAAANAVLMINPLVSALYKYDQATAAGEGSTAYSSLMAAITQVGLTMAFWATSSYLYSRVGSPAGGAPVLSRVFVYFAPFAQQLILTMAFAPPDRQGYKDGLTDHAALLNLSSFNSSVISPLMGNVNGSSYLEFNFRARKVISDAIDDIDVMLEKNNHELLLQILAEAAQVEYIKNVQASDLLSFRLNGTTPLIERIQFDNFQLSTLGLAKRDFFIATDLQAAGAALPAVRANIYVPGTSYAVNSITGGVYIIGGDYQGVVRLDATSSSNLSVSRTFIVQKDDARIFGLTPQDTVLLNSSGNFLTVELGNWNQSSIGSITGSGWSNSLILNNASDITYSSSQQIISAKDQSITEHISGIQNLTVSGDKNSIVLDGQDSIRNVSFSGSENRLTINDTNSYNYFINLETGAASTNLTLGGSNAANVNISHTGGILNIFELQGARGNLTITDNGALSQDTFGLDDTGGLVVNLGNSSSIHVQSPLNGTTYGALSLGGHTIGIGSLISNISSMNGNSTTVHPTGGTIFYSQTQLQLP